MFQRKTSDLAYSIMFGLLSALFAMVQFRIPDSENAYSDLREIPLLLSLFHIKNPFWIVVACLLSPLNFGDKMLYITTFFMHILPLLVIWVYYQWLRKKNFSAWAYGFIWIPTTCVYYFIFLLPCFLLTYHLAGMTISNQTALKEYWMLVSSTRYEVVATTLVTGLYLVQLEIRKSLIFTNKNLEQIVEDRTSELAEHNDKLKILNEELSSTNEEIRLLNENLETIVQERTERINFQLEQLQKYAFMNSHEVRGPLARILGLLAVMEIEKDEKQKYEMLGMLYASSIELDEVVKRMNRLLEIEVGFFEAN